MKSIVFFIASLSSGGAEHQLSILANLLCSRGYNVRIVTYGTSEDHYHLDPRVQRERLKGNSLVRFWNIFHYFCTVKTDIVFGFGVRDNFLMLLPLLFRNGIKVIVGERNITTSIAPFYERYCHRLLYRKADFVVANSYTQSDYLRQNYSYLENKVLTITNYTDIKSYQYIPRKEDGKTVRIGIFSRFVAQKNFSLFIDAVSEITRRRTRPFVVHWYGSTTFSNSGQREYFDSCINKIKKNRLENILVVHDKTKDVASLIPTFDALCLPSLKEGFSNSISEYICCGRPVLCSDVSDNHIMVQNDYNGYLFDPTSLDSIVEAFLKFFSLSDDHINKMCYDSRIKAENLFDEEKFIESYLNILE